MATAAEIRNRAMKRLGVLSQGQVAQAEYSSDLAQAYVEVYAELDAMGLVDWDFDEEVPDELAWSVVALVAYARVDEYSIPNDRRQRLGADASVAINRMRELRESNVYNRVQYQATYY